ncbi:MAG: leucyl aminopeptidase [Proteobacteria bacterium]|nr:leucyl aminopeptidase [Pseudomonadota bacterium]TDJ37620.1 MAG: leucyl aminopeptidase [Gammaproteobacteria bacterium]
MEFFTTTSAASRRAGGCIIVGVYEKGKLGLGAADIDAASKGLIKRHVKDGDISGRAGTSLLLPALPGVRSQRVLVVGLGKSAEFGIKQFRRAIETAINLIKGSKVRDIVIYLTLEDVAGSSPYYLARYAVETAGSCFYAFDEMKSRKKRRTPSIKKTGLAVRKRSDTAQAMLGAQHAQAIVEGMSLARDLGNLPPNVCTPSYLARAAQKIARQQRNVTTKVLGEAEIKRLGMHAFLSVTGGTTEPAKLIVMQYRGAAKKKPVVLVGKGITFDAGGISLKPGPGMDEMKFDMCGAASVIATMSIVEKLKLPINLNVVVPTCENLPSGTATRPGDIVTSMSGKTIEILNTDAEGRLILCDALTYARRFKPDVLIDVATLTGACVIALGHHRTAVMSKHDDLADQLTEAGIAADDRGWRMPLAEEYEKQLRSNFADFANIGSREGGAITAACFLSKFTDGLNWAHLDIAGTAWQSGGKKGSTGRPVPMLTEFLLQRAGALP